MEEITKQRIDVARVTGKLKFMNKLSDWLLIQPDKVDKEALIQFLQTNVEED